jgi:hypothetical protein
MSCILIAFTVYLFVSSPPFLSVDLVPADTAAADFDYLPDDQQLVDPSFAAEQPGKQTPLTHAFVTYILSSSCFALEIAAICFILFLLHSLSL